MLRKFGVRGRVLWLLAIFALAACAEAELVSHTAKIVQPPSAEVKKGVYKVGKPYRVDEVWYYPKVDYSYRKTGIASWYGPRFQGRRTANGEIYDQYKMTAAHPTLPMPSMVRVTNLENGRSVVVRVNDRGPFKNSRIIDLSRKAAELLGFREDGTAKVLVEVMEPESRQLAVIAQIGSAAGNAPQAVPVVPVVARPLNRANGAQETGAVESATAERVRPAVVEPQADGKVTRHPVRPTSIYVQAGAFILRGNAVQLGERLSAYGVPVISQALVGDSLYYRVRLGPVKSVAAADSLLASLLRDGHTKARVVVD